MGGGEGADERLSWSEALAASGASVLFQSDHADGRDLYVDLTGTGVNAAQATAVVTVRQVFSRSEHFYTFHLGHNGGDVVPVYGATEVKVTLGSGAPATVNATLVPRIPQLPGSFDDVVTGLVQGVGPGPWTAPSNGGLCPPLRQRLCVYPSTDGTVPAAVEVRLIDNAGAQRAFFTMTAPLDIYQPARFRIQFRHPGAAGDMRGAVLVYRRA
jgi:hypothetical protein